MLMTALMMMGAAVVMMLVMMMVMTMILMSLTMKRRMLLLGLMLMAMRALTRMDVNSTVKLMVKFMAITVLLTNVMMVVGLGMHC